jgi:hypothetical protein
MTILLYLLTGRGESWEGIGEKLNNLRLIRTIP